MVLNYVKKKGGEKLEASHDDDIIFAFYNKLSKQKQIFQRSITPQSSYLRVNGTRVFATLNYIQLSCWYYWAQNTQKYMDWVL
jgi:hypothetical protein